MRLTSTLALTLPLATACAAPEMLRTEGALRRQVERACDRHDAYVLADASLLEPERSALLAESAAASALVSAVPEVSAGLLADVLLPVLDRHDAYARADAALDDLEREIYLATSASLRALLARAVPSPSE